MLSGLTLARRAAGWSLRFYLRHFWIVVGLSTVPTLQRFVVVRFGRELPDWLNVTTEVLTAGIRLLLIFVIIRLTAREDAVLRSLGGRGVWERFSGFVHGERAAFLVQFLVLGAAFTVFDILPNAMIAAWVPDARAQDVQSVLVAAKNPTVIALTMVWMVAVVREIVREMGHATQPLTADEEPAPGGSAPIDAALDHAALDDPALDQPDRRPLQPSTDSGGKTTAGSPTGQCFLDGRA